MHTDFIPDTIEYGIGGCRGGSTGMSEFFVVKGELAAWALGLEDSDTLSPGEVRELFGQPEPPTPRRRKRRLGHEWYRQPALRRRELSGR